VFTALLVAGRNSTAMVSQLGSMLSTGEMDAIRGRAVDPIRKLMTPRVLAAVLILPLLAAIGDYAGLFGGFIVATVTLPIDAQEFWIRGIKALAVGDLAIGFSKPVVFGFILATAGC
jgi:phospholipid/cholesterol/gamma-HCH transport system permease protein